MSACPGASYCTAAFVGCVASRRKSLTSHPAHEPRRQWLPTPASRARTTAAARFVTRSLVKMFDTLLRTVFSLRPRRRAIVAFTSPAAISVTISRSRGVSSGSATCIGGPGASSRSSPCGDLCAEDRLAPRHRQYSLQDLGRLRPLEDVSARPRPDTGEYRVVAVHHRQQEHRHRRVRTGDCLRCVDPADAGHGDVHDDDVRRELIDEPQRLLSRVRLAHQLGLGRIAQQRADPMAEQGMVVGDDRAHDPVASCADGIEGQEGTHDRAVRQPCTEAQLAAELGSSRPHRCDSDTGSERLGDARTVIGDLELEPPARPPRLGVRRAPRGRGGPRSSSPPSRYGRPRSRRPQEAAAARPAPRRSRTDALSLILQRRTQPELVEDRRAQVVDDPSHLADGALRLGTQRRHQLAGRGRDRRRQRPARGVDPQANPSERRTEPVVQVASEPQPLLLARGEETLGR